VASTCLWVAFLHETNIIHGIDNGSLVTPALEALKDIYTAVKIWYLTPENNIIPRHESQQWYPGNRSRTGNRSSSESSRSEWVLAAGARNLFWIKNLRMRTNIKKTPPWKPNTKKTLPWIPNTKKTPPGRAQAEWTVGDSNKLILPYVYSPLI
jgi:hypothetical protein